MIDYYKIKKLSTKLQVPEEIIEKDFFIELVLFYLARDSYFREKIIFRGGTSLKKIYFQNYRFSEDLDFLLPDRENLAEIEYKLNQCLLKINADYPVKLDKRCEYNKDRLQFFILYDLISEIHAIKELKVDVLKDNFVPAFQPKKILFNYHEFKQEDLYLGTYDLESIVSDKIGRILDVVDEPRDLYDLWCLLKLKLDIIKIKDEFKNRYRVEMYIPNLLSEIKKENYKRNWRIRLEKQITNLPEYDMIIKELEMMIKTKLIDRKR